MAEITLIIGEKIFKAHKQLLCEHSDYFRAMFSGNYVENDKQIISIDIVDAESMEIILQYMNGLTDLTEYSVSTLRDLTISADFLQTTALIKQIEYVLDLQMSPSNCLEIMSIAQNSGFAHIEQLASTSALFSFNHMKLEYIPNVRSLCWYLSQPYLDTTSELDVYNFGEKWKIKNDVVVTSLIILGCLDVKRLTLRDLKEIKTSMSRIPNSEVAKVVNCLHSLLVQGLDLSVATIQSQEHTICHIYSESIYNEVLNLVTQSRSRLLKYTPAFAAYTYENHSMFTFTEKDGFECWLQVAEKESWDWCVIGWGLTKLVLAVCGKRNGKKKDTVKHVKVYDIMKKEWICHGVEFPALWDAGMAILEDSLYIVGGGSTSKGKAKNLGTIYDLKKRTYRRIENQPDIMHRRPAMCVHEGSLYVEGFSKVYRYEVLGDTNQWTPVIRKIIKFSCMVSFKGYIYCAERPYESLFRFKPGVDEHIECIGKCTYAPTTMCNLGNRLLIITKTYRDDPWDGPGQTVEEYTLEPPNGTKGMFKVLWHNRTERNVGLNYEGGSCISVLSLPPTVFNIPDYVKEKLERFGYMG